METPVVIVLHEGSGVVAVVKPAGLATQAPPGIDSLEARVRRQLCDGPLGYLGVPHRLDRPVSGVMLFALSPRAARKLSRQFERRQVRKRYRAILDAATGRPSAETPIGEGFEWRDLVVKVADEPRARVVTVDERCDAAKEAVTRGRWVGESADRAGVEVEFEPETGRMHQLRVQAAHRGMPVLGDALYGSSRLFLPKSDGLVVPPIALHASSIEYLDPDSGRPVVVESPTPWPPTA